MNDYVLIDKTNISKLQPGMHIKYIKQYYDENDVVKEKICNGGILINLLDTKKIYTIKLLLKTNIYWQLHFLKYKIYAKNMSQIENIKYENKDKIKQKTMALLNKEQEKINLIMNKKTEFKIYNIV